MVTKTEKRKGRIATARRRLDEHKHGSRPSLNLPGGVPFFNPKDDAYTLTVLPFKMSKAIAKYKKDLRHADPGDLYYEQSFFVHRDVGPDTISVVCPYATYGRKCPICEERQRLSQDPKLKNSEEGKKTIKALAPKERQLFAVYDHEDRKKGVQLWEISPYNFGYNLDDKIKKSRPEVREDYEAFHDPDGGFDLRITGREKSMGPGTKPFNEFFVDEFIPRKKPIDAKLMEKVPCLCEVPACMEYEELSALFFGTADEGGGKKRRHKDEDEDEDEDRDETEDTDDEDGDDEGAEEGIEAGDTVTGIYKGKKLTGTVKKVKGTLATVAVKGREKPWMVELDELTLVTEDEDEDEDEDDEAPKKRTTRGKKEDDDDEGEEDDEGEGEDDDEEEEESSDEDEDDDEPPLDDEDEDDDSSSDDDDEDEDSSDDEDEDDDEPKKRGKTPPPKKRRRK